MGSVNTHITKAVIGLSVELNRLPEFISYDVRFLALNGQSDRAGLCPLLALSGHSDSACECPLSEVKRTSVS